MRIGSLDDLKCKIQQDGFFEDVVSSVNDWNEALDRRDDDVFDSVWSDAFEELKNLEYSSESDEKAVSEIREYVFKKIYELVRSPDVAGYISDDIGLVAESISKSCSIEWVGKLFDIYCAGEFPN
ncbi:hypothetical protein NPS42_01900 [Pseudomonas putida]|uniref:hypothetical protein n=1 Tax=Pseudomonas putida TaxID=303 RepID=UPI000A0FFDAF|nr:hypothetical protein [Pseudomonas putida]MDD2024562.1 hypothetical protein [Pseudomonas putida]ORL66437.1 hypothetical protein B7H19_20565 [Pseudomonas putida]HDS1766551.1 hypothetical protein [Pseudomonas putida]